MVDKKHLRRPSKGAPEVHEMLGRRHWRRSLSIKYRVVIIMATAVLRDNEFAFVVGASYSCKHVYNKYVMMFAIVDCRLYYD